MMENHGKDNVSSNSSSEDPNPCPICLGPVLQESYLDNCFRTLDSPSICFFAFFLLLYSDHPPSVYVLRIKLKEKFLESYILFISFPVFFSPSKLSICCWASWSFDFLVSETKEG